MRWLNKLLGRKALAFPKDVNHPPGPVQDPITHRPKPHYEYFVHDNDPNNPGLIWYRARAYLPARNEDGTWRVVVKEETSPAPSVELARQSAQKWGMDQVGSVK